MPSTPVRLPISEATVQASLTGSELFPMVNGDGNPRACAPASIKSFVLDGRTIYTQSSEPPAGPDGDIWFDLP
jgi:hypothetical protein